MKTCIIIAHPYHKSFNYAVLNQVKQSLEGAYSVIDLYQDQFNPVLYPEELKSYNHGTILDPKVLKYQELILDAQQLIFIFPIWWYGMPAILKGFLDKVLTPGFAFDEDTSGLVGRLTHIKRVIAITSSEVTNQYLTHEVGNPIGVAFLETTLNVCGIKHEKVWLNCEHIASGSKQLREDFLKHVATHIKTLT
jgi:NAD(P)H dehydrogenase (quinone)